MERKKKKPHVMQVRGNASNTQRVVAAVMVLVMVVGDAFYLEDKIHACCPDATTGWEIDEDSADGAHSLTFFRDTPSLSSCVSLHLECGQKEREREIERHLVKARTR